MFYGQDEMDSRGRSLEIPDLKECLPQKLCNCVKKTNIIDYKITYQFAASNMHGLP